VATSCRNPMSRSPSANGFGFGSLAKTPVLLDRSAAGPRFWGRPIFRTTPRVPLERSEIAAPGRALRALSESLEVRALSFSFVPPSLRQAMPKGKVAQCPCPTRNFNGRHQFVAAAFRTPVRIALCHRLRGERTCGQVYVRVAGLQVGVPLHLLAARDVNWRV
jgi:hypothetical protein